MADRVLTERDGDTHLIATVFQNSSTVTMYKDVLCGALGLTVGERVEIASHVDKDRSTSYSFWSVVINKWIEKNGSGATVNGLSMRLRKSDFNTTADELLKTLESQPTPNKGNNKTDNVSTIVKKFEKIEPAVQVQFPKPSRIAATATEIAKPILKHPVVPLPPEREQDTVLTRTTSTTAEHARFEKYLKETVMSICLALFPNENGMRTLAVHDNTGVIVSKEFKSCLRQLIAQGYRHPAKFNEFIGILLANGLKSPEPCEVILCIFRKILRIDSFLKYSVMPSVCSEMVYVLDIPYSEPRLGRLENMFKADLRARNIECAIVTNFLVIQVRRPSYGWPLVVPDDKITLPEATGTPRNHSVETCLVSIICYDKERDGLSVYICQGETTWWEYYTILQSGLIGDQFLLPGLMSKFYSMDSYHKYEIMNDRLMGENERIHSQRILSTGAFFVYGYTGQRDTILTTHTQPLMESEGEREGINEVKESYQGGKDLTASTTIPAVSIGDQSGELDFDAGIGISLSLGVGLKCFDESRVLPALLFALCYSPSSLDSIILCPNPENMYDKEACQVIHDIKTTLVDPLRRRHEGSYEKLVHHFRKCVSNYFRLGIFDLWQVLCEELLKLKPFVHFIETSQPSRYGVFIEEILPHGSSGLLKLEHQLKMDASMNDWTLTGVPKAGLFIRFPSSRFSKGMLCNLKLDLSRVFKSHSQANLPKLQLLAVFCETELWSYIVYHRQVNYDGIRWVLMNPNHKELKLLVNFEEDLLGLFRSLTLPSSASEELRQFVQCCVCAIYVHM